MRSSRRSGARGRVHLERPRTQSSGCGASSRDEDRRVRRGRARTASARATRPTCSTCCASSARSSPTRASGWSRSLDGLTRAAGGRVESVELSTSSQVVRMAWTLPRLLRRLASRPRAHAVRDPTPLPVPAVVTVHDVSFERAGGLMSRKDRAVFRRVVPRAVRRAARVLTVSERTKPTSSALRASLRERVVVTRNGVDPAFVALETEGESEIAR